MAEERTGGLVVRIHLQIGRRAAFCLMAAAMMASAAPELASESITLTTYYPAPSGIYAQMITTGATYLARDSAASFVGIGTTTPVQKLDVNGAIRMNQNNVGGRLRGSAVGYFGGKQIVLSVADGAGASRDEIWIGPNESVVSGHIQLTASDIRLWGTTVSQQLGCTEVTHSYPDCNGGHTTLCGAGQYITEVSGIMSEMTALQPPFNLNTTLNSNGTQACPPYEVIALCCPCPGGVCHNFL